jgi:Calx-beta domain/FG-GAP-like repeat
MWLQTFFKSLSSTRRRTTQRRPRASRPRLEPLEDRCLPSFVATLDIEAGTAPRSAAVGEFNGDDIPDLAVANSGGVSVLLGNGDGTFQAPRNFDAGHAHSSVTVGDFNGDGRQDLAVNNKDDPLGSGGSLSVLLGNGDGTFQTRVSYLTSGNSTGSVTVGDFNGDDVPDLVVLNYWSSNGSVLLGNGDGTFQAALNFAAGREPISVAVGDFNGDGLQDLAVANSYPANVGVLLGNGDGTFQPPRNFDVGTNCSSVAVGEFNGDGIPDLAVAGGGVSVLLGNGDGTFQAAHTFTAGPTPFSVAVGEFNGDAIQDLAVANYSEPGTASVLLGNGDGTFQAARSFVAGIVPMFVTVGDLNSDGLSDLAVANFGSAFTFPDSSMSVLLGTGDGKFQAAPTYPTGNFSRAVAVGEFNGDGLPDLAVASDIGISVLSGNGDGTFQAARNFAAGTYPQSVAVGEFNSDSFPDLAVANGVNVTVLLGNGDGTFQAARNFAAGNLPRSVAVGEFNGDGLPDLAVANDFGVSVLLGNGDGTFQAPGNFAAGSFTISATVGEFNGDGIQDLAVANLGDPESGIGQGVSVLLGNGDGSFQAPRTFTAGSFPRSVAVGEFNGDGLEDLAVANSATYGGVPSVSVLLGNGDGSFQAPRDFPAGRAPWSLAVSDISGDGLLDLAVLNAPYSSYDSLQGNVRVLLGNGDGTFQTTPVSYLVGREPRAVAVGDFDGDGWPDLAVANSASDDVSILLNVGSGARPPPPPPPPPPPTTPSITISDLTVTEGNAGTRAANFTVTLSAASSQPVTVNYATANGSASAGSDYQATSGTLTIPAGQTTGTITVLVNGDRLVEPSETFFVNLSSPTNATIADGQGLGSIVDDEPRISISDVSQKEGKKGKTTLFTFTVTLSVAYDQPVTLSYRTVNGTATTSNNDYVARSGTLTFLPGETTKTITIEVKGDRNKEANETFYLDLFGLSSNALFTRNRGIGTILNDD